jgi:hypothetical protein
MKVTEQGDTSRIITRVSGETIGWTSIFVKYLFIFIDTIMARRQLMEIKKRVEQNGTRKENPVEAETGKRDQYQYYEVIFASGEKAGVAGKENAPKNMGEHLKAIEPPYLTSPTHIL